MSETKIHLSEVDSRLIEALEIAADEWGALGVLHVAAAMWPAAASVYVATSGLPSGPRPATTHRPEATTDAREANLHG